MDKYVIITFPHKKPQLVGPFENEIIAQIWIDVYIWDGLFAGEDITSASITGLTWVHQIKL